MNTKKNDISEKEIQDLVGKIERKDHVGLFEEFKGFDVQAERKKGEEIGEELKVIKQVCKKLAKGQDPSTIADMLEEDQSHVQAICDVASSYAPDYDAEKIYEQLAHEKELV
jgi:hypothetical protein